MNMLTPVQIPNHSPTMMVGIILNNNNHAIFFLVGDNPVSDAGESPKRKNTTFTTW